MERYFSEALYRSGKFVACLFLVILTSCALLFWQDSKLANLVNGSMANLTDNMQSMAIKIEGLTLLIQKIEKLEQKNRELEMKIENLVDRREVVYDNNGCKSNQYYRGKEI